MQSIAEDSFTGANDFFLFIYFSEQKKTCLETFGSPQ